MSSQDVDGPWGRTWILTVLLLAVGLGSLELFWRARGEHAGVASDTSLWSHHRAVLADHGSDAIALLGSSRMQMGFSVETAKAELPNHTAVQLAVAGKGPVAVLRDLASDETFVGKVLCSVFPRTLQRRHLEDQQPYVDHYREVWGPGLAVGLQLAVPLQEQFVLLQSHLGLRNVLTEAIRTRRLPTQHVHTLFSRQRVARYAGVDLEAVIEQRLVNVRAELNAHAPDSAGDLAQTIAELRGYAERIATRGGKVAFIALPIRGRYRELSEQYYPREQYSEPLARDVGALTLWADDLPGVAELHCPDESHLANEDVPRFTRILLTALRERGMFTAVTR